MKVEIKIFQLTFNTNFLEEILLSELGFEPKIDYKTIAQTQLQKK